VDFATFPYRNLSAMAIRRQPGNYPGHLDHGGYRHSFVRKLGASRAISPDPAVLIGLLFGDLEGDAGA
jgi:hypothetical protein